MNTGAEYRLQDLGITLPPAPKPLGAYVEAVRAGNLLFLSGALPIADGTPRFQGRIGSELTIGNARAATRLATLNALALARKELGSLDKVTQLVRLTVYLVTTPEFREHPQVADAASELLADVFGREKASARMVVGALSLPAGVSVVVELTLSVDTTPEQTSAAPTDNTYRQH